MKKNNIEKFIRELKLKPIENYPFYYASEKGKVYKIVNDTVKEISSSKYVKYDFMRVNLKDAQGRQTTRMLHTLIYETFKGKINQYDDLKFIDGDYKNCSLDNLITVSELLEYYRENQLIL